MPYKRQESNLSTTPKEHNHSNIKITGNSDNYSLISLNIIGLNSPIKTHRLMDWIRK